MRALNKVLKKVFGTPEGRLLKSLDEPVARIGALAESMEALSDQELRDKTVQFKRRLAQDESLDDILEEAFAVVRESSRRFLGMRHYDVQIKGGVVLHQGTIAEMVTGEGKTLVATLPAYLNALEGKGVHIVTVNDYLAQRDRDWMAPVFEGLGITVGCIQSDMSPAQRQPEYAADITYGTNNEFGFDYLRDNMKSTLSRQVQGPLHYAIVDEVDSILIDEARTPLIISGSSQDDAEVYRRSNEVAQELKQENRARLRQLASIYRSCDWLKATIGREMKNIEQRFNDDWAHAYHANRDRFARPLLDHVQALESMKKRSKEQETELKGVDDFLTNLEKMVYAVDEEHKNVVLTETGETRVEEIMGMGSIYSGTNMQWPHLINNALRAHELYLREREYVIKDGEVIIVDEFTGRLMDGRRWTDGLHQAVEAKEASAGGAVEIREEQQTLATITLQNYFKLYTKLAGMTGTAKTEESEFYKIYKLTVVPIPTNRPLIRDAYDDLIFGTAEEKFDALAEEIERLHKLGRPVLVGTTSVEKSEALSGLLQKRSVRHVVLNAKRHKEEAAIVAQAGRSGAVTISTNMAGRGTDILLGGNPSYYILGEINSLDEEKRDRILELLGRYLHSAINKATAIEFDDARAMILRDKRLGRIKSDEYEVIDEIEAIVAKHEKACRDDKQRVLDPKQFDLDAIGMIAGADPEESGVPWWHQGYRTGGLHVLGTERHESRRVDNQLRGRCGRQGDPGSSQFFLSLEDDLMRIFAGGMIKGLLQRAGLSRGQPIQARMVSGAIEKAQRKVEARNFEIRKNLLEYDEVMDKQRKTLYTLRQGVLEGLTYIDSDHVLKRQLRIPKQEKKRLEAEGGPLDFERWYDWFQTCMRTQRRLPQPADDDVPLPDYADRFRLKLYHRFRTLRFRESDVPRIQELHALHADLEEAAGGASKRKGEGKADEEDAKADDDDGKDSAPFEYDDWYDVFQAEFEAPKPLAEGDRWIALKHDMRLHHLRSVSAQMVESALDRALDEYSDPDRPATEWELDLLAHYFNAEFREEASAVTSAELAGLGPSGIRDFLRKKALWERDENITRIKEETAKLGLREVHDYIESLQNRHRITLDDDEVHDIVEAKQDVRSALIVERYKDHFERARTREVGLNRLEQLDAAVADATGGWDLPALVRWIEERTRLGLTAKDFVGNEREQVRALLKGKVDELYDAREKEMTPKTFAALEQFALLETIDACWKDHLREMDFLRSAVSLVGYAQKDPKIAYKTEGFKNFQEMLTLIEDRFTQKIFRARLAERDDALQKLEARQAKSAQARKTEFQADYSSAEGAGAAGAAQPGGGGGDGAADDGKTREQFDRAASRDLSGKPVATIERDEDRIGRNDPCPCNSGKKYKRCHGAPGAPPLPTAGAGKPAKPKPKAKIKKK